MDTPALDNAISALENKISSLERFADSLEVFLWIATAAVVIGVALELGVIVHEYRVGIRDWRRGTIRSPERPSRRLFWVNISGALLVTLGVLGELALGVYVSSVNANLRNKNR